MTQAIKSKRTAGRGGKRREPSPADYNDEISEKVLNEIRLLAQSKDTQDQRWETVRDPAW